jgi:uncharacterized protein
MASTTTGNPLLGRLRERREEVLAIAARYGASNVRVFGSVARGEERPDSDIDLLVDMEPRRSLLDLAALGIDLEALVDRPVDVFPTDSLKPHIRVEALRDAIPL